MKKYIAVFLLLCILLSACGSEPSESSEVTTVAPDDERTSVTLAVFGRGYEELTTAAARFNYTDDASDFRIDVVDYCDGGISMDQALLRLNSEIGAGNGPDMIAFADKSSQANNVMGITHLSYMSRGWLVDMGEYLAEDDELSYDDLVNVDALNEFDGIYILGNGFKILTAMALSERFGERTSWTIQEYLDIEASLEPWQSMCYYMNDHYFLENIGGRYSRHAINWKEGTCDFNNSEFIEILEAAGRVKDDNTEEFETLESFTTAWQRIGAGQLIVGAAYISNPSSIKEDEAFSESKIAYIGWPTPDGSCGSDFELMGPVGICTNSEHKDACWEFIKYYVKNPELSLQMRYLPLYRPKLAATVSLYRTDEFKGVKIENKQDVLDLYEIIELPEHMAVYDETVVDIIIEEAEEYFAGNRTAEDAAARVQERVSLYVAEQS